MWLSWGASSDGPPPSCGRWLDTRAEDDDLRRRFLCKEAHPCRLLVYSPTVAESYVGKEVAGQFRIVERIGSGGMGAVYKAEQPDMNRHVAIKILHPRYMGRADLVSRFRREARAMSHLSHPNTARVFLYGQLEDGACYFVMEYLAGRNLAQVVRAEGPMTAQRAIPVMSQACAALDEAHRAGIIHRDLKPENIFLTTQGGITDFPKVLDFGLAKVTEKQMKPGSMILTREGMVFGTPEFMSPEQARGKTLDARSDIYSLGIIIYELLTGKLPFDAKQPIEFIQYHVNEPPILLSERVEGLYFPPGLEAVVMRALAKDPDDRFASAADLGAALEAVLVEPSSEAVTLQNAPQIALLEASRPTAPRMDVAHNPAPVAKFPYLVLAAGILLAIGGAIALAIALSR